MPCLGLKVTMIGVSSTIFLVGAALLGIGVWVYLDLGLMLLQYLGLIKDAPTDLRQLTSVGVMFTGISIMLVLTSVLGCYGAIKDCRIMLLNFSMIVLVLLIAQLAGAAVLLVFQTEVNVHFEATAVKVAASIGKDYGTSESLTAFWKSTMKELNCCGYNNYIDFTGSPYFIRTNLYPPECCQKYDSRCTAAAAQADDMQGCAGPLVNRTKNSAHIMGTVAMATCVVETVAMVISMVFYMKLKRQNRQLELEPPASTNLSLS